MWLHLPAALGAYIPHAVSLGFSLHHAVEQQVVLCQWLAGDRASKLPAYSSHQVGVAGLVLWEEHRTVLAVKDRLKVSNSTYRLSALMCTLQDPVCGVCVGGGSGIECKGNRYGCTGQEEWELMSAVCVCVCVCVCAATAVEVPWWTV